MDCATCGTTKSLLGKGANRRYRCRPCEVRRVSQARRNTKIRAVAHLGGRCMNCGYDRCVAALEFHHRSDKDFQISNKGNTLSWNRLLPEIEKCDLLCANCHREEHSIRESSSEAERVASYLPTA